MLEDAGALVAGGRGCHDGGHSDRPRREHRDGAFLDRRGGEVVSVGPGAGQRQEQPAGTDCPRVELHGSGDTGNGGLFGADVGEPATDDVGDRGNGQSDHVRCPAASSAAASSSRSSKGRVTPRLVCPGSWPLPATSTTSPGCAHATA